MGGRAKTSKCQQLRREQGKLQNCREDRPLVADTWTGGWEVATRQRGMLRIYGLLYAQVHLALVGKYARNGVMGGQRRGARVVRTRAGGGGGVFGGAGSAVVLDGTIKLRLTRNETCVFFC